MKLHYSVDEKTEVTSLAIEAEDMKDVQRIVDESKWHNDVLVKVMEDTIDGVDDFADGMFCAKKALIVAGLILHRPCVAKAVEQAANEVVDECLRLRDKKTSDAVLVSTLALLNMNMPMTNSEKEDK